MKNQYTASLNIVFVFLIFCLSHISAFAQHKVQGKVLARGGEVMSSVNVTFLSVRDSVFVAGAVTDSLGRYGVTLDNGKYVVRYSYLSCRTVTKDIDVEGDMELPAVVMEPSAVTLDEVSVTANKQTLKLTGSGLLVDVENDTFLNRQNDIYDLLGRIPGVMQTGRSVQVLGKSSLVFYVNGRKVMDVSEVDNLQVDQIKSVKVVTGTDVSYNAGNSAVIDIRTKRLGDGLALNVTGNLTQGKYLSARTGFYSSYNTGKWDYFLSYYYDRPKSQEKMLTTVQTLASTVWNKNDYTYSRTTVGRHSYKGWHITFHRHRPSACNIPVITA